MIEHLLYVEKETKDGTLYRCDSCERQVFIGDGGDGDEYWAEYWDRKFTNGDIDADTLIEYLERKVRPSPAVPVCFHCAGALGLFGVTR